MYPRQKMEECEKMLSVNSITKMLTKESKYSDRGSPWIYQLGYHPRTCCKKGSVKINDNTLINNKVHLTKGKYDDRGSCLKEERQ